MPISPKVSIDEYYERLPSAQLRAGDIWQNLPTFGHLRRASTTGVVFTPACDLTNRKAETIAYLPVVPITDYLLGPGFSPELFRAMRGQAQAAMIEVDDLLDLKGFDLPSLARLTQLTSAATVIERSEKGNAKQKAAASRVIDGSSLLHYIRYGGPHPGIDAVKRLLGDRDFGRTIENIIRNNHSADIHFLPRDSRTGILSAMEFHSVVLFRYPLSLPFELLDIADDVAQKDWNSITTQLEPIYPVARTMRDFRPLRVSTLKPRFYSDVLARFSALHIRMGAPDFTRETVAQFCSDIGALK